MEKISVLISGNDEDYDRSLAVALSEAEKNMFVSCVSPEKLMSEEDMIIRKFDILLLEEGLMKARYRKMAKTVMLCAQRSFEGRDASGILNIFKYKSVKTIASDIYREYSGKEFFENQAETDEKACLKQKTGAKIIGIAGGIDEEACAAFSLMFARAMAISEMRAVYFNINGFNEDSMAEIKEGVRTWDDFIYCAIYGKTDDVLSFPERFASKDESGLLYFNREKGKNPFSGLERDEIEKFYSVLKEKLNQDYVVAFIPDSKDKDFYESLLETDIAIIVNDGSRLGIDSGNRIIKNLKKEEKFKGKVITICFGGKWDTGKMSDFNIPFSRDVERMRLKELMQTDTWKEISRAVGFIGDGCIE